MADQKHHPHHPPSPIVQMERRRGTALALVAVGTLIVVALFFLMGDFFLGAVPEAEAEANLVVETDPVPGAAAEP